MNLKLLTVMGTSWILEFISTFSPNQIVELILDSFNIFYGCFIFIIFVFKRKVFHELKQRFGKILNIYILYVQRIYMKNCLCIGIKFTRQSTPRSTTTTNSGNINMRDMATNKSSPLLVSSPVV